MAVLVIMLVALDLYTTQCLLIPYYTGFIRHLPNGSLPAFQLNRYFDPATLREIQLRLSYGRALSPGIISALWVSYLASTLTLAFAAIRGMSCRPGTFR